MSDWIELADWMQDIVDETPLVALTIPGTHDSGAYDINYFKQALGQTQENNISNQLRMGVRFLDIRLNLDAGHLAVYHGSADCHLAFHQGPGSVIGVCKQFLGDHPKETIIISVKEEGDWSNFDQKVREAIDADPVWFKGDAWPTIGGVRGRIILMRRWNTADLPYGIDAQKDWGGKIFKTPYLWVQDDWNYKSIIAQNAREIKFGYIETLYRIALQNIHTNLMFINFMSANGGVLGKTPKEFAIGDTDGPKNPGELKRMQNLLENDIYGSRCGIIVMDFAGNNTARDLIPLLVGRNSMDDSSYWSPWANDFLWGFANPKMFTLGPVNALIGMEQDGFGIINMQLGFIDPVTQAQRWTDWNSRNSVQDKKHTVYLPAGKFATQIAVWFQGNRYGIIDAELVSSDGTRSGRLTYNNNGGDPINVSFSGNTTNIYGFKTQENAGNGLINIMIGKQ